MNKSTAIALTLLVSTLVVGLPVWLAVEESQRQGLEAETARNAVELSRHSRECGIPWRACS